MSTRFFYVFIVLPKQSTYTNAKNSSIITSTLNKAHLRKKIVSIL